MDIQPIRRRRLYQDVADHLEAMIRDNRLKEGDVLPAERELMEQFQVGRPAVREALLSLQKAGLISVSNGERARVTRPDAQHFIGELSSAARVFLTGVEGIRHFQEARQTLEIALARHAARFGTAADIARIGGALERNRRAVGDIEEFERSDVAFHYEIVLVARNPLFNGVHQAVVHWLTEQRDVSLRANRAKPDALAFHERIYEGIAAHDPDAAEAAMRDHLESVAAFYWQQAAQAAFGRLIVSYVIWVEFDLHEEGRPEFLRLVRENAATSVRDEPGCSRFDVLEALDGAGPVALYEIYDSEAAFRDHLASDHFKAFDARSAPLVRAKTVRSFHVDQNAKN